jgi:nucleotide-binding universal stress UspA family protein
MMRGVRRDSSGTEGRMFSSIVVGTDGSQTAREAVGQAVEMAQRLGSSLHIVSAYEPVSGQGLHDAPATSLAPDPQWVTRLREEVDATLEEAAAAAREAGVEVSVYARQGDAADAILDVAEERGADLVIIGNKGMTGAKRFLLGSVPNKVSHYAPCAVMIIRTR